MHATILDLRPRSRGLPALSCAVALGLLIAAAPAWADYNTFCVSTSQQLQDALDQASDGGMYNGQHNYIHVVKGIYKTTDLANPAAFLYNSHYPDSPTIAGLEITGGYDPGCATSSKNAAKFTVLDGDNATQVLRLYSTTSYMDVTGLTIRNGLRSSGAAGLEANLDTGYDSSVSIIDSIILNNHTTNLDCGFYIHVGTGNSLLLEDNVIAGNSADAGIGAGTAISDGYARISQNTVWGNTTIAASGVGGLVCGGAGQIYINNNIIRNNSNIGLDLETQNGYLGYNDYGNIGGMAPVVNVGALMVSPQFVNAAGNDFHLAANSPLLGIAPVLIDTIDLEGHHAPAAGKMDLGAYQETVFIDGFDGG